MESNRFGEISEPPHPLLNIHILEVIFSECSVKTLLECRVVCHAWNSEAVRMLEKKQVTAKIIGNQGIPKFLDCIRDTDDHPFSYFLIELPQEDALEPSQDVCDLMALLSHRLRHIKFEYDFPTQPTLSLEEVQEVLPEDTKIIPDPTNIPHNLIILPVLNSLHIFCTTLFPPQSPTQFPNLFNMLKTPSLTTLSIQHLYAAECSDMVVKFIESSLNPLFSLRMPCTEFLKTLEKVKLQNLKELDICDLFHGSCATNEIIQCIKENCLNLEVLSIELGCRVTFGIVFKLFETLAGSLTQLKLIIQDKNLLSRNIQRTNFNFPFMGKLQSLFLRYTNPGLVYYIDGMPLLTSLELETPWTRKVRGNLFPGLDEKIYGKLNTFKVSEKLTTEDVISTHRLFPNLRTLCASFKSDEVLLQVFKTLQGLHCLVVDRNSDVTDYGICGVAEINEISDSDIGLIQESSMSTMSQLKSLKLVQKGISWKGLTAGVCHLKQLKSLTVQALSLKINNKDFTKDDRILQQLATSLPQLQNVCIWVRRNSERLSSQEIELLDSKYSQWNIDMSIQSICTLT